MSVADKDLYQILVSNEYVEEDVLKKIQEYSTASNISLYDGLIDKDIISDENLGKLISDHLKLPFVSLSKVSIPEDILKIVPLRVAMENYVISFSHNKLGLKIATSKPNNPELIELISKKVADKVKVYYATERDIKDCFRLYKKELQKSFDELLKEQVNAADKATQKEAPVAKIVDLLIEYAYQNKASDIHIEPSEEESLVRFRIDGILHDVLKFSRALHDQVITRIKVLSRLRTDEHLSAQDGKLQVKLEEENLDVRISIVPIVEGEKTVMRLLSSHSRQFGLGDLGMNETDLEKVRSGFLKPYGMILSTGPTGSGKTTTMYSILKILNTRDKNIATIEDPVEYEIEGLNQIQVNAKTNLTFAEGLRSILRQDPDIIYVGEIRDEETADIAINSAMTGHMVLSTLHTNDAATSLPRLIDMGIEPFLVASTVNVIIAQRLVRKICEKCKFSKLIEASDVTKHIKVESVQKFFGSQSKIRVYEGKGCSVCHLTGYTGRVGVFEILVLTESIEALINEKVDANLIAKKAIEEGMTTMLEDGLEKVQRGVTTVEEVLRATKE